MHARPGSDRRALAKVWKAAVVAVSTDYQAAIGDGHIAEVVIDVGLVPGRTQRGQDVCLSRDGCGCGVEHLEPDPGHDCPATRTGVVSQPPVQICGLAYVEHTAFLVEQEVHPGSVRCRSRNHNTALLAGAPTSSARLFREHRTIENSPRVEPLEAEVVQAIIEAVPDRYRALVVLAAGTGLCQGECFGLTLDRVDLLRRQLTVDRQLVVLPGSSPVLGAPTIEAIYGWSPFPLSSMPWPLTSPATWSVPTTSASPVTPASRSAVLASRTCGLPP